MKPVQLAAPDHDASIDEDLRKLVAPDTRGSFFLSAGAGSGKTRSLVQAVVAIQENYRQHFVRRGERVAVITYTNAACDEIVSRVRRDALFHISTIHSFSWSLISSLHHDIQQWLLSELP